MTFKGKTVVSVSFGANIDGIIPANKNASVLFADNTTMTVTYNQVVNMLAAQTKQQADAAANMSDLASLKGLMESDLDLSA